jgi:hypothetical protein
MFAKRITKHMSSSRQPEPAGHSEDPDGRSSLQEDLDSLDRHRTGEVSDGYYLELADQMLHPGGQPSERDGSRPSKRQARELLHYR